MKNNQSLLMMAIILAGFTHHASADPVTVSITGNVIASPCTFDTSNSNLSVSMGDISAPDLAAAGTRTAHTSFKLVVKDCPVSTTKVTATFSGTLNSDLTGGNSYANTGTAAGVAVQVKYDADAWSAAFGSQESRTVNVAADHTATFPLWAAMYTPSGNGMPGTVNATMTATFTYQ
ncbi:fimbrial protein [Enterobacteriaceae bacterium C34A]